MSYLGQPQLSSTFNVDTFSGNGSQTAFTLSLAPASRGAILVLVAGVRSPIAAYTLTGATLTFSVAPVAGVGNVEVVHLGLRGTTPVVASGTTINSPAITGSPTINGDPLIASDRMVNRAINGEMAIDQRYTGATITAPNTAAAPSIDGWVFQSFGQANKFQVGQSTNAPTGFKFSLAATSLSAYSPASSDLFVSHRQDIEGISLRDTNFGTASARQVAVSFRVFSSLTGLHSFCMLGAGVRSYVTTYTVSVANTWEYKTVIVPGDVAGSWTFSTSVGMTALFDFGSGSNYNAPTLGVWSASTYTRAAGSVSHVSNNGSVLLITGFQVLVSPVAAPMIQRLPAQELALCQRYYEKSHDISTTPGSNTGLAGSIEDAPLIGPGPVRVRFAVSKRVPPSMNVFDAIGNSGLITIFTTVQNNAQTSFSADNIGNSGFKVFVFLAGANRAAFHWSADARL